MTHICVGNLTIIGPDNGLSPGRRQAFIWTNAGILLIGPLGTNFSETVIEIHTFSFKKMHLKISSAKWRLFCLGLNELRDVAWRMCLWHHFVPDRQRVCTVCPTWQKASSPNQKAVRYGAKPVLLQTTQYRPGAQQDSLAWNMWNTGLFTLMTLS